MNRLQRLGENHAVEGMVAEEREAAFQVDLENVDIIVHAVEHRGVVDLHAVARRLALLPQGAQERAVAAAEIQHPRLRRDPLRDGGQVRSQMRGSHSSMLPK